jgi:serine/threonine-protein kinase HipA
VLSTGAFYGLDDHRALQVVKEIATAVDGWQDAARKERISSADVDLTASAFNAHTEFRESMKHT